MSDDAPEPEGNVIHIFTRKQFVLPPVVNQDEPDARAIHECELILEGLKAGRTRGFMAVSAYKSGDSFIISCFTPAGAPINGEAYRFLGALEVLKDSIMDSIYGTGELDEEDQL